MPGNESEYTPSTPSTPSSPSPSSLFSYESISTDRSSNSGDVLNNRPTTFPAQPLLETSQESSLFLQLTIAITHLRKLRSLLGLDPDELLEESAAEDVCVAIEKGKIDLLFAVDIDEIDKLVFMGHEHQLKYGVLCSINNILRGEVGLLKIMGNLRRHCRVSEHAQSLLTKFRCFAGIMYHGFILTLYDTKVVEGEKPEEVRALGLFLQQSPEDSVRI